MASASSFISEEQFLCSICLDLFSQPVTIPCGHSFCEACIIKYWDSSEFCHCPMCKKLFQQRPDLFVNTLISEVAAHFRKSKQDDLMPVEVPCDVCPDTKLKALRSCLVCLASYCETHLEPHHRDAAFKTHKLIDAVRLEDRMCKDHGRMLELFCRTDQTCICIMCLTEHKAHDPVPLEVEYEEKQPQLEQKKAEVLEMIQERQEKIQQFKISVEQNNIIAEREKADTLQVCSALVSSIQRTQAELIEVIELKTRSAAHEADGLIKQLEEEITELQRKSIELEQLSHTEDHLHLLQSFLSLSTFSQLTSGLTLSCEVSVKTTRTAIAQLQDTLDGEMEKLPEVKLKKIQQQYAVDVTLDPDTAHPNLILSSDGKQVKYGNTSKTLPDKSERFDTVPCVLGKEACSSGKYYYEVQLKGKTAWTFGFATKSIKRKGNVDNKQCVILQVINGGKYSATHAIIIPKTVKMNLQKIGVFVDYELKQISFYDIETRALLSRRNCTFKEELYPFFSPVILDGDEPAPLIITKVNPK